MDGMTVAIVIVVVVVLVGLGAFVWAVRDRSKPDPLPPIIRPPVIRDGEEVVPRQYVDGD